MTFAASAWVLGGVGQALFVARSLLQWRASERAGRSVTPPGFWALSIFGSLLLGVYAAAREEPILLGGYLGGAWIYVRIARAGSVRRSVLALWLEVCAVLALVVACAVSAAFASAEGERSDAWWVLAFTGQILWSSRFAVQWVLSETSGVAGLSRGFWWTSLVGNLLLLSYALHRQDALLIAAFAWGPALQVRNLVLSRGAAASALETALESPALLDPGGP